MLVGDEEVGRKKVFVVEIATMVFHSIYFPEIRSKGGKIRADSANIHQLCI